MRIIGGRLSHFCRSCRLWFSMSTGRRKIYLRGASRRKQQHCREEKHHAHEPISHFRPPDVSISAFASAGVRTWMSHLNTLTRLHRALTCNSFPAGTDILSRYRFVMPKCSREMRTEESEFCDQSFLKMDCYLSSTSPSIGAPGASLTTPPSWLQRHQPSARTAFPKTNTGAPDFEGLPVIVIGVPGANFAWSSLWE